MEFGSVQSAQITVDLSRKIEFLPKKGPIIGKNARFSVKTDAEAQILYVQREDLVCSLSICIFRTEQNSLFVIFPLKIRQNGTKKTAIFKKGPFLI